MKISTPLRALYKISQLQLKGPHLCGSRLRDYCRGDNLTTAATDTDVHVDVRCLWREKFLTSFGGESCIIERQDDIANGYLACPLNLCEQRRKIIFFDMSWPVPRSEESIFSKVPAATKSTYCHIE